MSKLENRKVNETMHVESHLLETVTFKEVYQSDFHQIKSNELKNQPTQYVSHHV